MAQPTQLLSSLAADDSGSKAGLTPLGQAQGHLDALARVGTASRLHDERIPLRVSFEIDKHLPNSLWGGFDFNFSAELHLDPARWQGVRTTFPACHLLGKNRTAAATQPWERIPQRGYRLPERLPLSSE